MLAERVKSWTEEWKRQGLEEGRKEGRKEGISHLLRRQLEKRFGVLPEETIDFLAKASPAELEQWGENLLDAHGLEEVFRS